MAILQATITARISTLESDIQSLVDHLELTNLEALSITEVQALFVATTITFDPSSVDYTERDGYVALVGVHHPHLQIIILRPSNRDKSELYFGFRRQRLLIKSDSVPFDGTDRTAATWDTVASGGSSEKELGL